MAFIKHLLSFELESVFCLYVHIWVIPKIKHPSLKKKFEKKRVFPKTKTCLRKLYMYLRIEIEYEPHSLKNAY